MMKKIVLGMALGLLIVGIAAPQASASCVTPKSVSTYNPAIPQFVYWHSTLAESGAPVLMNKFWTAAADETGTCLFAYFGQTAGDIGLTGSFGDPCLQPAAACPVGSVSVLVGVTKGGATDFIGSTTPETPSGGVIFDFSNKGGPMVPLGRPRITSSSKAGSLVNVTVAVDAISAGLYDGVASQITGYNLLSKASATDPGRAASSYDAAPLATVAAPNGAAGSTPASVDCSAGLTRWVAVQIQTAGGPAPFVGAPVQVSCSPSLADPKLHKLEHKPANTGR